MKFLACELSFRTPVSPLMENEFWLISHLFKKGVGMKIFWVMTMVGWAAVFGPGALSAAEPTETPEMEKSDTNEKLPIGPILVGSYGLVTIALGAGFALQAYQENEDFNKSVDGQYPHAAKSLADDIKAHSIAANVLMFSGLAVTVGGILWWVLSDDFHKNRSKKEQPVALTWRPVIGPTQAGVVAEF